MLFFEVVYLYRSSHWGQLIQIVQLRAKPVYLNS